MAKKKSSALPLIYCVGMLATVVGFILPIFRKAIEVFDKTQVIFSMNGFDLFGDGDSTMKIMVLLVFIGAAVGVLLSLLQNVSQARILRLVALVISIVGGVYCFLNVGDFVKEMAVKVLFIGFYMIVAGWVVALIGWIMNK